MLYYIKCETFLVTYLSKRQSKTGTNFGYELSVMILMLFSFCGMPGKPPLTLVLLFDLSYFIYQDTPPVWNL